ncbi:MAG: hypothetical protein RIK87_19215 [Fuerstiella sp.]
MVLACLGRTRTRTQHRGTRIRSQHHNPLTTSEREIDRVNIGTIE